MLTIDDWHRRFTQQARWSEELRRHLYTRLNVRQCRRILEVGCGTGVITAGLHAFTPAHIHGLDLNPAYLRHAHQSDPAAHFTAGDALVLPYPPACFDLTCCHFFLLWVTHPEQALAEMRRVTRPGGHILALAEPDYGGRIDYPLELAELGRLQGEALRAQGADPFTGRRLAALLHHAGLEQVESGLLGGHWAAPPSPEAWEMEWAILAADLGQTLSPQELHALRQQDAAAWQHGERILFVPTFYALGTT